MARFYIYEEVTYEVEAESEDEAMDLFLEDSPRVRCLQGEVTEVKPA